MPATFDYSEEVISLLPQDKVFILDRLKPNLMKYPAIYQDFEADVRENMLEARELLVKYKKNIMVFPSGKEPIERIFGFEKFCREYNMSFETIKSVECQKIRKGEVYYLVSDRNLVSIIKKANREGLHIGEDIGIISFNDTLLKEVVAEGITTISTDFSYMGKRLAQMVQNKEKGHFRNPSYLIKRKSL